MPPSRRTSRRGSPPIAMGPHVVLRLPRQGDRAAFDALLRASRAFLAPWEPRVRDPGGRLRFTRLLEARRKSSGSTKCLIVRRSDDAILGCISLNNVVRGVFQSAAIGYWIGAPHARQGYMREAVSLMLRHAFHDLGLHRVECNVIPTNRASLALARGLGFRREGLSPRYLQIAGRWQDHVRLAMLVEEWRSGLG